MSNDPTKDWVAFLVEHGGYSTLLSIPAMVATFAFIARIRWLKSHHPSPHAYGRTGLIYWPSQVFIASAIVSALGLAFALITGPYLAEADGLLMSCFFLVIAWVRTVLIFRSTGELAFVCSKRHGHVLPNNKTLGERERDAGERGKSKPTCRRRERGGCA